MPMSHFKMPASALRRKDVNVHILDSNQQPLKVIQCEKRVIIDGIQYFKKHLESIEQFESIDIHVQCDPIIFQIIYDFAEAVINLRDGEAQEKAGFRANIK